MIPEQSENKYRADVIDNPFGPGFAVAVTGGRKTMILGPRNPSTAPDGEMLNYFEAKQLADQWIAAQHESLLSDAPQQAADDLEETTTESGDGGDTRIEDESHQTFPQEKWSKTSKTINSEGQNDAIESSNKEVGNERHLACKPLTEQKCGSRANDANTESTSSSQRQARADNLSMLDFGMSLYVPIRIRNVFSKLKNSKNLLSEITVYDALENWKEIETFLHRRNNFGEQSSTDLRKAVQNYVGNPDQAHHAPSSGGMESGEKTLLIDFGVSEHVPVRIRNVFKVLPTDNPLVGLRLKDAAENWMLIKRFLLSMDNFGETSCDQLMASIKLHTSKGSIEKIDHSLNPDFGQRSLCNFVISQVSDARILNCFLKLPPLHPLRKWRADQAILNQFKVAKELDKLNGFGERSKNILLDLLDRAFLATPETQNDQRDQDAISFKQNLFTPEHTEKLRENPFGKLPAMWLATLYGDESRLITLSSRDLNESNPKTVFDLCAKAEPTEVKLTARELILRSNAPARLQKVAEWPKERTQLLELSVTAAFTSWPEIQNWLSSLRNVGDESIAHLRNELGNYSSDDQVKFANHSPMMATNFLSDSLGWIDEKNGEFHLTPKCINRLDCWLESGPSMSLSPEWICIHLLIRLFGPLCCAEILELHKRTYTPREVGQRLPKTLLQFALGNSLSGIRFRKQITATTALRETVDYLRESNFPIKEPELSFDDVERLLLMGFDDRNKKVIEERHFYSSGTAPTLDILGTKYQITRERVRQICKSWSKQTSEDGRSEIANHIFIKNQSSLIERLNLGTSEGHRCKNKTDVYALLPRSIQLVMEAAGYPINDWIDNNSVETDDGFYFIRKDDSRIIETEAYLKQFLGPDTDFPILLSQLKDIPPHFNDTVHVTDIVRSGKLVAFSTPEGVVISDKKNADQQRLAYAMSVFERDPNWILSDQRLWAHICETCKSIGPGTWRTFTVSIRGLKKRFCKIPRIGWLDFVDCQLSQSQPAEDRPLYARCPPMGNKVVAIGETNQRSRIYELVSKHGCVGSKELMDLWAAYDGGSGTSAGFLVDDPFFVSVHPGSIGCLNETGELNNFETICEKLGTVQGLTTYLMLRRGGFIPLDFPAWNDSLLKIWLAFTQDSVAESIAPSVCQQLEHDIGQCKNIKEGHTSICRPGTHFNLNDGLRRPVDSIFPTLEQCFNILASGAHFSFVNWYLVNCCTGRHWFSHRCATWLALLIALGAIEPEKHWQDAHAITERGIEIFQKMIELFQEEKDVGWHDTGFGHDLLLELTDNWKQNITNSWVPKLDFSRLLNALHDTDSMHRSQNLNDNIFQRSDTNTNLPLKGSAAIRPFMDPQLSHILGL